MIRQARIASTLLGLAFALLAASDSAAGEISFRRQLIDANSQFTAVAVFDVNHDGNFDIVCGSSWYEAPTWKKHFVREVESLGNPPRYDGYAHLPMDVNSDGWIDIITVNYRSRSIKWIEHPGASLGPWTAHTIDEPGPAETGRLVDIDGDGRLDILPNGVQVAGWWELLQDARLGGTRPRDADAKKTPRWLRHDLPREVAGHGLGFGDIDGDGRGDLVGPRGWLQAPPKPREDRWQWHAEFDLDGASIPILIVDADGDGDNDIVWSRAHNFGIYWIEQDRSDPEKRRWTKHTIDTAWAGAHAPLWADLDGDGQNELVAGKRYLAHEGRDPGEYDPLVSYRYQFDRATRSWQRSPISLAYGVGFGLDPKAIDLDADGDLDLVCSDRCGLFVLENLRVARDASPPVADRPSEPSYEDHTQLLVVKDRSGAARPVTTPFDWGLRRSHILAGLEAVIGSLPNPGRRTPLDAKLGKEIQQDGFIRKEVVLSVDPDNRLTAELFIPSKLPGKASAVLCLQHDAAELAKRGYICIVPAESDDPAGSMKNIWKYIRAIDLLESLPEVNIDAIGCIGEGNAVSDALLTAVFDQRIAAVACATPRVARQPSPQHRLPIEPITGQEILAAIAPRGCLIVDTKNNDTSNSRTKQLIEGASAVYKLRGAESKLRAVYPESDAEFTKASHDDAYQWLDSLLKRPVRGQ